MRLSQFLSLQSPLILTAPHGERVVALAFGLTTGRGGGELVAMTLPLAGGTVTWRPVAGLEFPAPIQPGPVAQGPITRRLRAQG